MTKPLEQLHNDADPDLIASLAQLLQAAKGTRCLTSVEALVEAFCSPDDDES